MYVCSYHSGLEWYVTLDIFPPITDVTREEYAKNKKGRCVSSIDSALEPNNYDKFKIPGTMKKFSVKVKTDVRPAGKIEWVNNPPPTSTSGRRKARQTHVTHIPCDASLCS